MALGGQVCLALGVGWEFVETLEEAAFPQDLLEQGAPAPCVLGGSWSSLEDNGLNEKAMFIDISTPGWGQLEPVVGLSSTLCRGRIRGLRSLTCQRGMSACPKE